MEPRTSSSSQVLIVPQADQAISALKYEIAEELGIVLPAEGHYGHMSTRDTGTIGGHMTRKLVKMAQEQLSKSMV